MSLDISRLHQTSLRLPSSQLTKDKCGSALQCQAEDSGLTAKVAQLAQLFDFGQLPDAPAYNLHFNTSSAETLKILKPEDCKRLYVELQRLKVALLRGSELGHKVVPLLQQNMHFPVIQNAVRILKDSFSALDDLYYEKHESSLAYKVSKIKRQLNNLASLVEIMQNFCTDEAARSQLAQLAPYRYAYEPCRKGVWKLYVKDRHSVVPQAILNGTMLFSCKSLSLVREGILRSLSKRKITKEDRGLPKGGVTAQALKAQAELLQAMREANLWASRQVTLLSRNELGHKSANDVYELGTKAFFKVSAVEGWEWAGAHMEKLIWDLAVLFGAEELFVATGTTSLYTRGNGSRRGMHWCQQGENLELVSWASRGGVSLPLMGSIQPAQKGLTLQAYHQALNDPTAAKDLPAIDRRSLIDATAISIVFGMWDAHSSNIWVTPTGKLKFFDNCKSLPHSNGYFYRKRQLKATYRSSLLEIEGSYKPLSAVERMQLKDRVRAFLGMKPSLDFFFELPQSQYLLTALPSGWLKLDLVMDAMHERLCLMAEALCSPGVLSLRDLVAASIPHYRFSLLICTAISLAREHLRAKRDHYYTFLEECDSLHAMFRLQCVSGVHGKIGHKCELQRMQRLLNWGVDVSYLYQLANDPLFNCEEAMLKTLQHLQKTIDVSHSDLEIMLLYERCQTVVDAISSKAAIDNKGYNL
jgi:hypothetical protein